MKGDNNLSFLYLMVFFCLLGTCSRPDQSDMKKHFSALKREIAGLKSEIERDRSSRPLGSEHWVAEGCREGASSIVLRAKENAAQTLNVACAESNAPSSNEVERP